MTYALLLSPHLDDAILSCAGRIQHHVAAGQRVVLLTIFSHADPDDTADWAARREEDRAAASQLGAEIQWLGWPDAPFRDPWYRDPDALTGPHAPGDAAYRARLAQVLRQRIEAQRPSILYVPLGVGDHVDHRLVHEAAAGLPAPRVDYEDRPYALVSHAVRRRLDALGRCSPDVPPPPSVTAYLEALTCAPYFESTLPPGPSRERCLSRLARWPSSPPTRPVHAQVHALDPGAAQRAEAAVWAYRSQAPVLYGTPARYRALTRAHAHRLGLEAPHAERYWRGVGPDPVTPRRHPGGSR